MFTWCQDDNDIAAMAAVFPKCPGTHSSHLEGTKTSENAQPQHYSCTFTQLLLSRKITKAFHKYWTHTTAVKLPTLLLRLVNKYYVAASKPTGEDSALARTAALSTYLYKNK